MSRVLRCPTGGCTFAEDPHRPAPEARVIWDARHDPGTIVADAVPGARDDPDAIESERFAAWLTMVADETGEHVVMSDGLRHIRLDVRGASLCSGPVILHYQIAGSVSARPLLLPLRRVVEFWLHRRFAASLFPRDPRIERWLLALRVHDAVSDGANQREIAEALFGIERTRDGWGGVSDSLRSQVRRLVGEARALAHGGYRTLMRRPR